MGLSKYFSALYGLIWRLFFLRIPANMIRWPNVGLLLGQRRRRWPYSKPTLGQRLMFAGIVWGCHCVDIFCKWLLLPTLILCLRFENISEKKYRYSWVQGGKNQLVKQSPIKCTSSSIKVLKLWILAPKLLPDKPAGFGFFSTPINLTNRVCSETNLECVAIWNNMTHNVTTNDGLRLAHRRRQLNVTEIYI